jgi:hypothetical protein
MSISRDDLWENAKTGDLLLYNSNTLFGRIIEKVSFSKFSHVAIIVKDPTHIHPDLSGLYVFESGAENISDVVSDEKVIGVQLVPLDYVLSQYENARFGYLYYRRLRCDRTYAFERKIEDIIIKTDKCEYDLNPIDWIKARFDIELGEEHKENTFWCSALVSYVYSKLGFLDNELPWTIIAPRRFSFYENECLTFYNCFLEPERWVNFT